MNKSLYANEIYCLASQMLALPNKYTGFMFARDKQPDIWHIKRASGPISKSIIRQAWYPLAGDIQLYERSFSVLWPVWRSSEVIFIRLIWFY